MVGSFFRAAGFLFCVEICVVTVTEALHDDVQRVVVSHPQQYVINNQNFIYKEAFFFSFWQQV